MSAHRHAPLTGHASAATLLREGLAVARSALGAGILLGLIVAGLCTAVFATAGRAAAAEHAVATRIDQAGTRLITVQYTAPVGGFDTATVDRLAALSQADWVFGLGPGADSSNDALGPDAPRIPTRAVFGQPPKDLSVVTGRWPRAGEAVVTADSRVAAGLLQPAGALRVGARTFAVVGEVRVGDLLPDLDSYALVGPAESDALVTTIYLLADRASDVPALGQAVQQLLGVTDPRVFAITSADVLSELDAAVKGELGASGRAISGGVLAAGMAAIALATLAAVSARRRDFGRRRALGASRGAVVGLVITQVAAPALIGAVVGTAAGVVMTHALANTPGTAFIIAVPVLAATAALVAATPIAYLAARRDPVRILRVA